VAVLNELDVTRRSAVRRWLRSRHGVSRFGIDRGESTCRSYSTAESPSAARFSSMNERWWSMCFVTD
jgi:hypothetical protein